MKVIILFKWSAMANGNIFFKDFSQRFPHEMF